MSTQPVTPNKPHAPVAHKADTVAKPTQPEKKNAKDFKVYKVEDGKQVVDWSATRKAALKRNADRRLSQFATICDRVGALGAYKPDEVAQAKILAWMKKHYDKAVQRLTVTNTVTQEDGFVL